MYSYLCTEVFHFKHSLAFVWKGSFVVGIKLQKQRTGANVEHPGRKSCDVIRKGRLYIEKPVLFLDLSCWRQVSHILISPILSIIESAFQGGGWNSPHLNTFTHFAPCLVEISFADPGYQTLQPAVGWWWPTQPSDHWFWWGGDGGDGVGLEKQSFLVGELMSQRKKGVSRLLFFVKKNDHSN